MPESAKIRDAIVMSGWTWESFNTPERVALALAGLGAKVLYCENPVSFLRRRGRKSEEIEKRVYRLGPEFLGHRLNRLPFGFKHMQAAMLARQIIRNASELGLNDPLFFYPHGDFFVPLCREFKRKGFPLVHACFDYPEPGQYRHIELSNLTLVLSRTIFHQLKARYGDKIALIPEVRWAYSARPKVSPIGAEPDEIGTIPRPRLGYIGAVSDRLNLNVLEKILISHPEWQFLHFGTSKCLPLPNVHVISWRTPEKLEDITANLDVGFMPYDCYSNKNFHCMPLKVFDYFYVGLPVVATPIVNLWEFSDTIYFGDDAGDLCRAIQCALDEPSDSPVRSRRMEIARKHSIEELSASLAKSLSSLYWCNY